MIMLQATLGCKFTSGAVKRQIAALEASLIVAILSGLASSVPAASEYWVGASGDTNAPTGGTWTTTTPTVWSDGSMATANVGWTAGSAAVFGGTDPQTIAI